MPKIGGIIKKTLAISGVASILAFGKSCIDLGADLTEVQNVVDVTFGSMSRQVDAFAKNAITQFGLSELTAKEYMGTYGAMAKAFGIVGEAGYQMSASITGLTGDVASFYNISTDEAYNKLKSIFTGETESLKGLGVVMTQTALDQYALNNGFGKTTAKMTEQEKVMLRYRFVMSGLADASGDFARTSQSWSNQVRILTLQFESFKSTIGQGLINAFTPVIRMVNTLLAKMQTLAAYFKAFTVALFGDASGGDAMSGAADASGTVADNMNNAAGAAKKMKEYTLGIDELNVLSPDNGGGSGSGAGGGALDFGDLSGDWTNVLAPDPSELVDKICNAFKDGNYRLAGEYISEGIVEALKSINWLSAYHAADNFGTGLALFLSGLITPALFGSTGETIAGSLNTALHFLNSFGVSFDWSNFGTSVVTGINSFFQTFDFKLAAESVNHFIDGIKICIVTALKNLSWKDIMKGVGEFLGTLEIDTVAVIIGAFVIKNNLKPLLLGAITKRLLPEGALSISNILLAINTFSLSSISLPALQVVGNQIIDEIEKFIAEHLGENVGKVIEESVVPVLATMIGLYLGGPIGAGVGLAIGLAIETFVLKGELINKFWRKIRDTLFNWDITLGLLEDAKKCFEKAFNSENFLEFGENILLGIANGMVAAFIIFTEPIADFFNWIVDGICDIFGIHSPAKNMEPYGEYILQGIIGGFEDTFSEWWDSMNTWYESYIAPWFTKKKWSELYKTIKTELGKTWDDTVVSWDAGTTNWWNDKVLPLFTTQKWNDLYESVKTQLGKKWNETSDEWNANLTGWWSGDVSPWFTKERWLNLYDSIRSGLKTRWDESENTWGIDIQSWWKNQVAPWFTLEKWSDAMGKIPVAFKNTFKDAVNGGIAIFNRFIDWINDHMEFEWDSIEIAGQTIVEGGSVQLFTLPHIPAFAKGGFPEDGLFAANSSELVGKFSNGRTAVANNEQIITGIQRGVSDANEEQNQLLREQNQLLRELLDKDTVIQMDSREVGRSIKESDRRKGYTLRTT